MTKEQKIQEEIAKERGLTNNQVLLVTRSMFDFIKLQIESGEKKPIRIPKWGLFRCKPQRLKKLQEIKDKKDNND